MHPLLNEQSVINANAQFWEQMLSMTLRPIDSPNEFCLEAGHMMGSVTLDGAWCGRIEVRLADALAYEATAAMMMQPADTVSEADVLDATKEIANMIAGTIKSSLPRPCSMTVPASEVERARFCRFEHGENSLTVTFHHATGELMVRICEQSAPDR
jgi:CheY-specific phosphatase CheX